MSEPADSVRNPTITTVPPMIASAPVPKLICASNRSTSTR